VDAVPVPELVAKRSWVRPVLFALLGSLLVLVVAVLAITRAGERALAECDEALLTGDTPTAIARARDAAMAVAPWSPYPAMAYVRLTGLADSAETRGDYAGALAAWRAVRTAIVASRSEVREAPLLADANKAIVRLAARACEGGEIRQPSVCAKLAEMSLAQDDLPPVSSFTLLGLGALAFLVGGAMATRERLHAGRIPWAVLAGAGVAAVVFALAR
jgi:hypothetical protein